MTLRTLNYGNDAMLLIMGNAGFCPSTVLRLFRDHRKSKMWLLPARGLDQTCAQMKPLQPKRSSRCWILKFNRILVCRRGDFEVDCI